MIPDLSERVDLNTMLSTGATYRQIDHWCRQGWLLPHNANPGSGSIREWTMREYAICRLIVRLTEANIETSTAAEWARDAIDRDRTTITTDSGVTITWDVA